MVVAVVVDEALGSAAPGTGAAVEVVVVEGTGCPSGPITGGSVPPSSGATPSEPGGPSGTSVP